MNNNNNNIFIRKLGQRDWHSVYKAMHLFTDKRNDNTVDEIWMVEHYSIFTQGKAGKVEHLLNTGNIPVVQSDRGGQVTYHGLGQQVMYMLIDIKRRKMSVRELITLMEQTIIATLADYSICSYSKVNAPGVYVDEKKICSLGLRISKGCSFHGLALNIAMELSPFLRINPCGYVGMRMIQLKDFYPDIQLNDVQPHLIQHFTRLAGFKQIKWFDEKELIK
ncbi:lipoyl(octanoyl) transferase LipB [Pantoea sp. Aalb]|uniref:lipoyl(octanoyl) transferase LipB n=1 Tax=Pantoea sp. Aalb TaxID=2576762 RepID=UPI0013269F98|nr:lipoyl(octanoyl) transferase LipB [Pantoea sp. Aalb]MXP67556.1 lipoyl(octanoyl) transferase LipB [Pantoea sp. Aalb]